MLNFNSNGRASFAAFLSTNLLTAGVALRRMAFAIGFATVLAVNSVTAQVPLAAEPTITNAGFDVVECSDFPFTPRWADAAAAKSITAHTGRSDFINLFIGVVREFAREWSSDQIT